MRVVIITGGSGSLGGALSMAFGYQGNRTLIHYHTHQVEAEKLAAELKAKGADVLTYQADLRNEPEVQGMAEAAVKEWGRIDLWINNAGMTMDRLAESIPQQEWDRVITTNLHGAFYGTQEAARVMVHQQQGGHIINIASLVGLRGGVGQAAYAASKAGLIGLTKAAAQELGQFNIQVNAVLPGILPSTMTRNLPPERVQQMIQENVLGRGSDLDEVSRFIYHLSLMKHVSGQVFNLDSRIF